MATAPSSVITPSSSTFAWMSWWDKYLAPGDVRAANAAREREQAQQLQRAEDEKRQRLSRPPPPRLDPTSRIRRQQGLLYGGIAFTFLSLIVTRRSLQRKQMQTYPRTFTPSASVATAPGAGSKVDGSLEAVEALGLATMNVFSFAMASVGAAMTIFDVADVQDLRDKVRQSVGADVYDGESGADREIEGWIAEVLSRRDDGKGGLRDGVMEKLKEIEREKGGGKR